MHLAYFISFIFAHIGWSVPLDITRRFRRIEHVSQSPEQDDLKNAFGESHIIYYYVFLCTPKSTFFFCNLVAVNYVSPKRFSDDGVVNELPLFISVVNELPIFFRL